MKSIIECKVSYQCGTKGVFNSAHNTRDFNHELWNTDGHIHYDKSNLNCVLLHKPPDIEWLKAHGFEEKIKAFDEAPTQKKNKSRRIGSLENFLKAHLNDSREIIVQLGDGDSGENSRNNWKDLCEQVGEERAREIHMKFFEKALEQFQKENPSFYVWGAYVHFDETTPHLHIDYLPLAEGKNVKQAFSLDGALKSMGYARKQHQTKGDHWTAWQADRRSKIEALASEVVSEFVDEVEIKILPSEPWDKSKRRQTTAQHRAEQAEKKAKAAEERTKQAEQGAEIANKIKMERLKETEDFVLSLEPTPTKTVKGVFGKPKEVPKSEDEINRDSELLAIQAIIRQQQEERERNERDHKRNEQEKAANEADRLDMQKYLTEQEQKLKTQAEKDVQSQLAEIEMRERQLAQRETALSEKSQALDEEKALVEIYQKIENGHQRALQTPINTQAISAMSIDTINFMLRKEQENGINKQDKGNVHRDKSFDFGRE